MVSLSFQSAQHQANPRDRGRPCVNNESRQGQPGLTMAARPRNRHVISSRRDLLPDLASIALFLIPFDSPRSLDILSRLV